VRDGSRDPAYLKLRRDSVRLATAATFACTSLIAAYALATWDRPHRAAILAITAVAVVAVVVIKALRAERIVETRWADPFFGAWSTLYVVLTVCLAWLDGGPASPLALTFFPTIAFAGICYPLWLAVYVGAACVVGDLLVGFAAPARDGDRSFYSAGLLAITAAMCAWQAAAHERQRLMLARLSRTDPLTGCLNRRGFREHLDAELARAGRSGAVLSYLVVDLDDFKQVNDARGHLAGDELLIWVVQRLTEMLRPSDAIGRLGGDEFALLLPGVDEREGRQIAGRLRDAIAERIDVSLGVGFYPQQADGDALFSAADAELYRDKRRPSFPVAPLPDLA
jgi:diguanylate cyclase (GGDEF)-like protein